MNCEKLKIINKILILVILLCIAAIILLVVFLPGKGDSSTVSDTGASDPLIDTQGSSYTSDSSGDDADYRFDETFVYDDEGKIEIPTPHCTLQYPEIWSENLKYTENNENGVYSVTFYSCMKGEEYEMFTAWFGAPEQGTVLGYLDSDGTQISFSVNVNDPVTDESWSEEEIELINSMTEGVNDVIVSVSSYEGFSKTQK